MEHVHRSARTNLEQFWSPSYSILGTEHADNQRSRDVRPSRVNVNDGLTLTASHNAGPYAALYPWISGVVTTEGKFTLPTTGWYVQVKAKMPDQSHGMWPAIWFLPGVPSTASNELDGYEGGWIGKDPNDVMHSDYFADQGQQEQAYDVGATSRPGTTCTASGTTGRSIRAYVDGGQVGKCCAERHPHYPQPYQISCPAAGSHLPGRPPHATD